MPNYFYLNANGQKQGPVNDQQLQTLATQGIIMPDTPLVTDGGHRGKAGQIRGLFTVPSPNPFTAPMPNQSLSPSFVSVWAVRAGYSAILSLIITCLIMLCWLFGFTDLPFYLDMRVYHIIEIAIYGSIWGIVSLATLVLGIVAMFDIWTQNLAGKGRTTFAIISGALYVIILLGIGIANFGGSMSGGESHASFTAAEQAEIERFCREVGMSIEVLADTATFVGEDGGTMLHVAAAVGNVPVAKFLVLHGANVNAKDDEGRTPHNYSLRHAPMKKYLESVGGKSGR